MVCLDVVNTPTKFGDDRREKVFSPQKTLSFFDEKSKIPDLPEIDRDRSSGCPETS